MYPSFVVQELDIGFRREDEKGSWAAIAKDISPIIDEAGASVAPLKWMPGNMVTCRVMKWNWTGARMATMLDRGEDSLLSVSERWIGGRETHSPTIPNSQSDKALCPGCQDCLSYIQIYMRGRGRLTT